MKTNVNHEKRAYLAWKELTKCAKKKVTTTYGNVASNIGIHHRAVRHVLGLIQNYCMDDKLPPLTILVINKETGVPGDGFIAWDVENANDGMQKVFKFNWDSLTNPFEYAKDNDTKISIKERLIKNPESSGNVYSLVKNRGVAQEIFRDALLDVYERSCAFCSFSFCEALEAAHIIPYSKCNNEQKLDVRNGLLLCANHHKLFDNGYITINDRYKMMYIDPKMKKHKYSAVDKNYSVDMHDQKIRLPKEPKHYPNKSYIKTHRNRFIKIE